MTESHTHIESMLAAATQYRDAGQLGDAEQAYRQILVQAPLQWDALNGLFDVLQRMGREADVLATCRQLSAQYHDDAHLQALVGDVLCMEGRYEEGLVACLRAMRLGNETWENYRNIGDAQCELGDTEAALESYRKTLELNPDNSMTHTVMGNAYRVMNRYDEARENYQRAIDIKPTNAIANWNLGNLELLLGNFERGFALAEKRFGFEMDFWPERRAFSAKPEWDGSDLQGKTILVWTEQGMGDNIMTMRYLPLLKAKGAGSVIVFTHKILVKMMLAMNSLVIDSDDGATVDMFDCHCSMYSLPYLFKTTLDTIPADTPYLRLPQQAGDQWRNALGKFRSLKVGLTWAGGKNTARDRWRSIALAKFLPLFSIPGVHFFVIQKGEEAREQMRGLNLPSPSPSPLMEWVDASHALFDSAALIDQLDLVISVDTVVAHVAGALGKPVWLLNRFESEWRWLVEGETSPWYPTMRIFRQPAMHDWDSVIAHVATELRELVAAHQEKKASGGLLSRVKNWFR